MDALEKLDKFLRRLSSKSRRATTRCANRHSEVSSSGSDEDDLKQQQTGIPKNDRKGGNTSRHTHSKSSTPMVPRAGIISKTTTTKIKPFSVSEKHFKMLAVMGFESSTINYNHICFAAALCHHLQGQLKRVHSQQHQQQQQYDAQKQRKQQQHAKSGEITSDLMSNSDSFQTPKALLRPPRLPGIRMLANDPMIQATAVSSIAHDKSCESEDAEYVSDCSPYGTQRNTIRKSACELDMSMDESLPESCGRESGYLSGVDVRCSVSAAGSPALSPRGVTFIRAQPLFQGTLETIAQQSFDDDQLHKKGKDILKAVAIPLQVDVAIGLKHQEEEAKVPDYESTERLLRDSIAETKYITTIFELSSGSFVGLIDDILNEFSLWFREEVGLLGIACELQWSIPEKYRHRASEKRMKEALHHSLRLNNRRLLHMKSKTGNCQLPLTMVSAITEENCARDCQLDCFQGVYRRFYTSLLPYQHTDTGVWHRPYWNLLGTNQPNQIQPNPEQFIIGHDATKLDSGSLVAVNVVALKIML